MQAGGAERVLTLLVTGLARRGHEIAVIAPHGPRDADLVSIPHMRLTLHDRGRTPAGIARAVVELTRAIYRLRPDLVHSQNPRAAATVGIAARLLPSRHRPPMLATFHGVLPSEYAHAARLIRASDHVVCVSNDLSDAMIGAGLPAGRTSVIHNAVELPGPPAESQREALACEFGLDGVPVAVIVARIVPQKAHERFIRAVAVAVERVPSARFLVIGDGPLRSQAEAAARSAGVAENIVFTGERSDARALIAIADLLVFSSDWEGLSIAALEAMASGTAVLSTDVQGMRELLSGGAGELVSLDDGTVLGERLADLLLEDSRRNAMGAAGIALIKAHFSAEAMIDAYERCYEQLIAGRVSGRRRSCSSWPSKSLGRRSA